MLRKPIIVRSLKPTGAPIQSQHPKERIRPVLLDRIDIRGFRRFSTVTTYVGRKTVALVGPNEAGKTSLLAGLALFGSDSLVDPRQFTRADRGAPRAANEDVVVLWMALTEAQLKGITSMPLAETPKHYLWHKKVDGTRKYSIEPRPLLSAEYRAQVSARWQDLSAAVTKYFEGVEDEDRSDTRPAELDADLAAVASMIEGTVVPAEVVARVGEYVDNVETDGTSKRVQNSIDAWRQFLSLGGPDADLMGAVRDALHVINPTFASFGQAERELGAEYVIADDSTEASIALSNLLFAAGISLATIRDNVGDPPYLKELLDRSMVRLNEFFSTKWGQEPIEVGLVADGEILRVFVRDKREDSGGWMDITERSEGLRMFVALATFVARQGGDQPPILLIDEADQHLHLNAQADLVRMLQELSQVRQVIYTTHSPGCLPSDLGNGVRFVEPISNGRSIIRHDFWSLHQEGHLGFNPILLLMGAGAAAFSGLRNALVVEGASDMLLLPTLIRLATGVDELPYQIAPGIAVASQNDMAQMDLIASRVAFMTDGDAAGQDWLAELQGAKVPSSRIKSLDSGIALEDLVDRNFYLATINDFLQLPIEEYPQAVEGIPVKTQVTDWATARSLEMPGVIAVAEQMLGRHESDDRRIVLSTANKPALRSIHNWAIRTFAAADPT